MYFILADYHQQLAIGFRELEGVSKVVNASKKGARISRSIAFKFRSTENHNLQSTIRNRSKILPSYTLSPNCVARISPY